MNLDPAYKPDEELELVDDWDWTKLQDKASGVHTGRLVPFLREAAATRNPLEILARAVIAIFSPAKAGRGELESKALADLAITGRAAYASFCAKPINEATLTQAAKAKTNMPSVAKEALDDAVVTVLNRAYAVAWALRGSPCQRAELRPKLGWIAVSGEDDPPHAPVNLPCTDALMGELTVLEGGAPLILRATLRLPETPAHEHLPAQWERKLPSTRAFADALNDRRMAGYDELFLFVHGLASCCEEGDILKKELISKAASEGRLCAVLSVDLPGMGYSQRLDIDSLIARRKHGPKHGFQLPDGKDSTFPLLGLFRDSLVQICNGTPGGVQYVMGGSLGGNMTLWLAAEPMFSELETGVNRASSLICYFAWSPASIWPSYERYVDPPTPDQTKPPKPPQVDPIKKSMRERAAKRMMETETADARWYFFKPQQIGEELCGIHLHAGWNYPPKKEVILLQSELYGEEYRRTFWAAGYEQLVFSHQEKLAPSNGRPFEEWPFKTIRKPLFLAAGENDRGDSVHPGLGKSIDIYGSVEEVTKACPGVPGQCLLMQNTGHSIHDERPRHLAGKIIDFLNNYLVFPVVFEHNNYAGRRQPLDSGCYDLANLSIGNDVISSVKVPPGWKVTLYQHAGFQGAFKELKSDMAALPDFNDMTSSLIVEKLSVETVLAAYEEVGYGGRSQVLKAGSYDMHQLSFGNDAISSLRVPQGWRVTLYEHAGFQGSSKVVTGSTPALPDFDNMASSVVVEDLWRTIPDVGELRTNVAKKMLQDVDLAPVFTGTCAKPGAWVSSLSPKAGQRVPPGTKVTISCKAGPLP